MFIESYGVRLDLEVEDEQLFEQVREHLPPGCQPTDGFPEDGHLTLRHSLLGDGYDVLVDGLSVGDAVAADIALHIFDAQVRGRIALAARDRVFIHAGTVAVDGQAILLPGASFAGKSTLVAALVRQGADYYSDEFAVLDARGRVHPYPKTLSVRSPQDRYGQRTSVESIGGVVGDGPAEVSLIAITRYLPGVPWEPARRDSGVGALALVTHAVPTRSRTQETMAVTSRAAENALVLEGDRDDADETAALLLAELSRHALAGH